MDKKVFNALLKNTVLLKEADFIAIQDYSKQYPFAAIFHQLSAKKAFTERPYEFDAYLSKAAIHSLDRKKLYQIIHANALQAEENQLTVEVAESDKFHITSTNIQQEAIVEHLATPIEENSTIVKEEALPFINGEFTEDLNKEKIKEEENTSKELKAPKLPATKKAKNEKKKTKKLEKPNTLDLNKATFSFTDWLKYINKHKPIDSEKHQKNNSEEDNSLEEQYHAGQFEAKLHEEIKTLEDNSKPIVNIPKIPTDWRKNVSEAGEIKISHLAQKSIEKTEDNVTETFAKILELQKKYDAAIDAYEKLSLKYPEKSSFFAVRILEIKNKMQ